MVRKARNCGLFLLLYSMLVLAQRPPQSLSGVTVQFYFHLPNSQHLTAPVQVELYSGMNQLLTRTTIVDDSTVLTLVVPGSGNYEIRVSGENIEAGTYPFEVLHYGAGRMQTIILRPARRSSAGAGAGPAEFLDARVPSQARKELEKGNAAAGREKWEEARVHYEAAIRAYANYAAAYFTLGLVNLKLGRNPQAREALERAVQLRPESASASTELARLDTLEKRFEPAEKLLQKVVSAQPENVRALFLLGNAQRELGKNSEAVLTTRKAHALPHRGFESVHLICGLALEAQAQPQAAVEEYRIFLNEAPESPQAPNVRAAINILTQPQKPAPPPVSVGNAVENELAATPLTSFRVADQSWAPAHVDSVRPAVQTVACPVNEVLEQAGIRVEALVNDLQQFTASEQIEHAEYGGGAWRLGPARTFEYVAEIQRRPSGAFAVQEYRNGLANILGGVPVKLLTTGMAAFALIFHPNYMGNFTVNCEGQSMMQDQAAWQIYFVQRTEVSSNFRAYWVAGKHYPIKLKGRAWISTQTYDVLRIETDLAEPVKDVIQREHIAVNYRSVEFTKRHERLRLPETAEIYMEFRGRRYRDRHTFGNYQLFSVDTMQQTKLPPDAEPVPN